MSNVVLFTGVTTLDLPCDQILEKAIGKLDTVIILGYDKDENEYFASSVSDGAEVLWLMERMKKQLLE